MDGGCRLVVTDCREATTGMEVEGRLSISCLRVMRSGQSTPSTILHFPITCSPFVASCLDYFLLRCQCIYYLDKVVYIVIVILHSKFNFTVDVYLDLSPLSPSFVKNILGFAWVLLEVSAHGLLNFLCRSVEYRSF